ncbi:hypothetical protein DZA65_00833 [Dickeya dianthicola]|nr:hypothetical protein DDI_0623 [Dickeya dianthicola RNS04.9]AYC17738.1 hypothetical protein DZA65_00833 [Dickeya dianthicola]
MFAVLADIEFELITYWDGIDADTRTETEGNNSADRLAGNQPGVRRR